MKCPHSICWAIPCAGRNHARQEIYKAKESSSVGESLNAGLNKQTANERGPMQARVYLVSQALGACAVPSTK